jgi:cell wall assembly regulator SMI1
MKARYTIMNEQVKDMTKEMKLSPPTTQEALKAFEERVGIYLPTEYKEFMLYSNGAVGPCLYKYKYDDD